jgi:nucleoside-diphosphate-sugar epimerase
MKTWIVTGASGFLGRKLLSGLTQHKIDAYSHSVRAGDIAKLPMKADVLVHMGARTGIAASWQDPRATYEANVLGTLDALELAKKNGAFFIFLSTAAYAGDAKRPTPESSPLSAIHPYGHSKALAEDLVRFYGKAHGVKSAVLRVFNVYGPGQSEDFLIPRLAAQVRDPKAPTIDLRNTSGERDFIHVDDVVTAIIHVGKDRHEGIFNVGTGVSTSVKQVLEWAQAECGVKKPINSPEEFGPNEVKSTQADISRLQQTGWSPRISLRDGLKEFLKSDR